MSQNHKKSSSLSISSKPSPIAKQLLKKSMIQIMQVQSLVGRQSIKWSFSKANRFANKTQSPSAEFLILKSAIGQGRSTGFGFGRRWEPSNPKGKDAPPSTAYNLQGSMDRKIIGGKISPSRPASSSRRWSTPGPGSYNLKSSIGNSVTCTMKSRHQRQSKQNSPSPGAYNLNHSLVESGRYTRITFGVKTYNDLQGRFSTPGPGTYDISSSFASMSPSPLPKRLRLSRKESL
ncbi:hypothetical protein SteCoe_32513 [Stentor coeruleus]|uniref:Uncharacterized protein n=1 Tax=Stentor coeruleus TaxID=5963 RepID=A0A1R2AYR9_9CILI|nr:hypothetical protein SteCoe_32513 [Stentor coeruleus]